MRIVMTGATGFVGTALSKRLVQRGDEVVPARRSRIEGAVKWSVQDGFDPPDVLSGFDAVIHLAGENVGAGRWTDERKKRIRDSRVQGTRRVVEALRTASPRPSVLLSVSAVGYYGATGERTVTEDDGPGDDFLAEVCVAWEQEALQAEPLGVRVVLPRFGAMLGKGGGMLDRLLPIFRLGVGGRIGSGEQPLSWVHLDDATRAATFLLDRANAAGPYNVVSPRPVSNATFTHELGRALRRPTVLPVPAFGVRLAFGEMGDTVLLHGQRALPNRLLEEGFSFEFPELSSALRNILK